MVKRYCSITVDVDNLNCYYRAYGLDYQDEHNLIYRVAIPRLLEIFEQHNVKATFFIITEDIEDKINREMVRHIHSIGHEIASHSVKHILPFSALGYDEQYMEIKDSKRILEELIGGEVIGFRTPGWDVNMQVIDILEKIGYKYDSSVFPSYFLSILKLMHRRKNLGEKNTTGMGEFLTSFSKTNPYYLNEKKIWLSGNRNILEIPVTVVPFLRIPFFGTFSFATGLGLFKKSYQFIRLFNQFINYELHPIELLSIKDDGLPEKLNLQPGMKLSLKEKLNYYKTMLTCFQRDYEFIPLRDYISICG